MEGVKTTREVGDPLHHRCLLNDNTMHTYNIFYISPIQKMNNRGGGGGRGWWWWGGDGGVGKRVI